MSNNPDIMFVQKRMKQFTLVVGLNMVNKRHTILQDLNT